MSAVLKSVQQDMKQVVPIITQAEKYLNKKYSQS